MDRKNQTRQKIKKLQSLWKKCKSLLIVMQDNPDPDAIAAATALKELANKKTDISCKLAYGGTIGRAENRELVHYLGLNFHPFSEISPESFDLIALIDSQPAAGNNPLAKDFVPDIVIDHHPFRNLSRDITFTDIRQHYGATSTILWEYLKAAGTTPEIPTATALFYGIRSDTQDLGRECTRADIDAMEALYPLANKRMLSQIQQGRVPTDYYQMLTTALANTKIYEHCMICNIGDIDNPDMIGEVADILLRHETVDWVMCFGHLGKRLLLSLRTQDKNLSAGKVVRKIVQKIGTGGGHASMAGGQIPLTRPRGQKPKRTQLERLIRDRFLKALKIKTKKATRLVHIPAKNLKK
jgi:nanoRNase/pAp phosphatase (c-di-AMP/oligoRNAs hydrolase)